MENARHPVLKRIGVGIAAAAVCAGFGLHAETVHDEQLATNTKAIGDCGDVIVGAPLVTPAVRECLIAAGYKPNPHNMVTSGFRRPKAIAQEFPDRTPAAALDDYVRTASDDVAQVNVSGVLKTAAMPATPTALVGLGFGIAGIRRRLGQTSDVRA